VPQRVSSCIIIQHKKNIDLGELTVAQLRARRRRLSRALRHAETTLLGSLVTQGRRCGKEGCRCAEGELHGPYIYMTLRKPRGRGGLLYVPAELAALVRERIALTALVRERIALTAQMQAALEEISEINLELLSRRQLD
jgi:hypothetical protein